MPMIFRAAATARKIDWTFLGVDRQLVVPVFLRRGVVGLLLIARRLRSRA